MGTVTSFQEVRMGKNEMFVMAIKIACAVHCKRSIAAKIYSRNMVRCVYIILKTVYINDNKHKTIFEQTKM
jgi:hypothetical protein